MVSCPKGEISRVGYKRKAYTRADGTVVKATYVRAGCVPDKGKPGKTRASAKVLPKPTPGSLGKYGYKNVKNTKAMVRRAALTKAVRDAGYATIVRRLNLIANYNKLSDPRVHKIMRQDMAWMKKYLAPEYSLIAKKKASRSGSKARSKTHKSSKRVKAGTKVVGGRTRQLYHLPGSASKFYLYKKADGSFGRRYV